MSDDKKTPVGKKSPDIQFAIINEDGAEIPVTEEMIEKSFSKAKPDSIGKHTVPGMPIITDEMIEKSKNKS